MAAPGAGHSGPEAGVRRLDGPARKVNIGGWKPQEGLRCQFSGQAVIGPLDAARGPWAGRPASCGEGAKPSGR